MIHSGETKEIKMSNPICAVTDEIKLLLKDFRFRKEQDTAALILKVDREKQIIILDQKLENLSIEELQESLPSHQPRYVILSYRQEHSDGRISFPLCFIFYTPRDSHAELQMMYAGSKISLQRAADLTRGYEIRELEDLNEEWLLEKLGMPNEPFKEEQDSLTPVVHQFTEILAADSEHLPPGMEKPVVKPIHT